MICAWCREPRHRDARGVFVKAIEVCTMKRYARTVFYERMEEMAAASQFYEAGVRGAPAPTFTAFGSVPEPRR